MRKAELGMEGEALRAGDVKSHPRMNKRAHLGQLRGVEYHLTCDKPFETSQKSDGRCQSVL